MTCNPLMLASVVVMNCRKAAKSSTTRTEIDDTQVTTFPESHCTFTLSREGDFQGTMNHNAREGIVSITKKSYSRVEHSISRPRH
jgi:hypothetical protein